MPFMRAAPAERHLLGAQIFLAGQIAVQQVLLELPAVAEAQFVGGIDAQEVVRRIASGIVALHFEERRQQTARRRRQAPDQQPPAAVGAGLQPGIAQCIQAEQHGGVQHRASPLRLSS
ncbi:hypothetical protein G6F68_017838 [Rhizopus microsporus]|nr:hypothetical protein G6F68_017838 [Rhizopus microsporus]